MSSTPDAGLAVAEADADAPAADGNGDAVLTPVVHPAAARKAAAARIGARKNRFLRTTCSS
jgi:hypothetical protein